jgi:hypothetical protein
MNPNNRENIMQHWDSWRKYIAEGGKASWPRDAFESLLDHFEEQIPSNSISRFEYDDLLEKVQWYFETMDAMNTVHSLLLDRFLDGKRWHQPKRYGAYRRLAIMAGEAESDLRELII